MRLKLDFSSNIRKSLSKIGNMVANGEIATEQANTIILACNAILGCIRTDEQAKIIKDLQEVLEILVDAKDV